MLNFSSVELCCGTIEEQQESGLTAATAAAGVADVPVIMMCCVCAMDMWADELGCFATVPSIVVHAGSCSCPASPQMERATRTLQRSLSKQEQVESEAGDDAESWGKAGDQENSVTTEPSTGDTTQDLSSQQQEQGQQQQTGMPLPDVPVSSSPLRPKSQNSKVKLLVRSHAMREETSPPPDPERATLEPPVTTTPTTGRPSSRLRLKYQGSSQGSMDSNSPLSLSRDSSTEQPPTGDSSGVDLPAFLTETVNRSHKDRQLLLRIEQDLLALARDTKRTQFKFPSMSSYQRMLVHRMAALYNMEHNVDPSGTLVVVARTQATKVPELRLRDQVRGELEPEPRRSILKRDTNSLEDTGFKASVESRRSKSFEEREEEYEKARKRIFKQDGEGARVMRGDSGLGEGDEVRSSQEELRGTWAAGGPTWSSSDSSDGRPQLLRPSPPHASTLRPTRLLKVESFESREHLRANSLRQAVSKSYSFGGYSGGVAAPSLARGDSLVSTHSAGARLLTKQDSGGSSVASRLSPLSSGYKSLGSQRSDATLSATPSPTATPLLPQGPPPSTLNSHHHNHPGPTLVWAVTNMDSTGQPYLNSDGSLYRYDPANPPRLIPATDPPPVHCAPQPPSIQVHPSYTCAPAPAPPPPPPPPPPVEYHQPPQQVVYTYTAAAASAHQQHSHPPCHPQEGCVGTVGAVSELATFLAGLQMGSAESNSCPPPQSATSYVMAPSWAPPQQQQQQQHVSSSAPRPPLLPQPTSPPQQSSTVVMPANQQTVLLMPPQRPMPLFPHSASEGYYSPPQQLLPPPAVSNNNPSGIYSTQHGISPSTPLMRPPGPGGEVNSFSNATSSSFMPATPTGICPTSLPPFCFSPSQEAVSTTSGGVAMAAAALPPATTVARAWCPGCLQSSSNRHHNSSSLFTPLSQLVLHLSPPQQPQMLSQENIPGPSSGSTPAPLCFSCQPPWQHSWPPGKLRVAPEACWGGAPLPHNQSQGRAGHANTTGRGLLLAGMVPGCPDQTLVSQRGHAFAGQADPNKPPLLPFTILPSFHHSSSTSEHLPPWGGTS
ncbi:hypothetical protein B566_EDAN007579 [Ephemera danica]|nr:hypothetical protein B566_EDAN007579 [Ephemera danica]